MLYRPRRNRKSLAIRNLVQETRITPSQLISCHFVQEGKGIKEELKSLPGVYSFSVDELVKEAKRLQSLNICAIALFPIIASSKKDISGSESLNKHSTLYLAINALKESCPDLCVITDVALDPYTSHGHDGVHDEKGEILNDETVKLLEEMSLMQAEAGSDMIAPSDMMDGRVGAIRKKLDLSGYHGVNILSYCAKYASSFYGPFRDTLNSHVAFGNKKTYQMNPANQREALLEAALDEWEGADILMVKPALPYLDIISKLREKTVLPIAGFQVSGEYAMIMAAHEKGWVDKNLAFLETALSIKRAGADMILTYAAASIASLL